MLRSQITLSGAPLEGARVSAWHVASPTERVSTTTDADGRFELVLDEASDWRIAIAANGPWLDDCYEEYHFEGLACAVAPTYDLEPDVQPYLVCT